jgi:hypothetical protein
MNEPMARENMADVLSKYQTKKTNMNAWKREDSIHYPGDSEPPFHYLKPSSRPIDHLGLVHLLWVDLSFATA